MVPYWFTMAWYTSSRPITIQFFLNFMVFLPKIMQTCELGTQGDKEKSLYQPNKSSDLFLSIYRFEIWTVPLVYWTSWKLH